MTNLKVLPKQAQNIIPNRGEQKKWKIDKNEKERKKEKTRKIKPPKTVTNKKFNKPKKKN